LRAHILPRFKDSATHALDLPTLQQFATDLRKTLSRKTVINILSAVFVILDYARKCGTQVAAVEFSDIEIGEQTSPHEPAFFTAEQANRIIAAAVEPYHTLFAVAWASGLRAGEILALNVDDIDFRRRTIRVHKSSDDATRVIHQTKTKKSTATLPMPSALDGLLQNYLTNHWTANPAGLLFPNRKGTRPRLRDNVVRYGLKPVLKKLGIPSKDTGLHAFRHGLATELVERCVPMTVLQQQMRHADVRTTLKIYSHAIPETQRDAMEKLVGVSIGTNVPIGTFNEAQTITN
jgi:integrase